MTSRSLPVQKNCLFSQGEPMSLKCFDQGGIEAKTAGGITLIPDQPVVHQAKMCKATGILLRHYQP